MKPHRPPAIPPQRGIAADLRRARLIAAKLAGPGCNRRSILAGHYDAGDIVRRHFPGAE